MNQNPSYLVRTRSVRRWLVRTVATAVSAMLLFGLWGWLFAWRKLPHYPVSTPVALQVPIMTGTEYEQVIQSHPRPYLVEIRLREGGGVLLYGATHTKDPSDPQIADIGKRWIDFRPTVALCESRLGVLFPGLMNPVRTFSEPGAVHALARKHRIPTYTWEPSAESQVSDLLKSFTKEQVALRFILGPYFSNLRFGRPHDPDAFVEEFRRKRSLWIGIENAFASMDEVQTAWTKHFPEGPDWRDVSDEFGLPGFFADLDTNRVRDEHFARVVIDLVGKGERVFAVAGLSHAVKLEPALRGALQPAPPDPMPETPEQIVKP